MEEGSFSWEGRKLHTNTWTPRGQARALVFICHGYGERLSPYYDAVGEAGAGKGLLCFGHDHTGHGQSEGERVQVSSMDEFVDPVLVHCKAMTEKHPGLPLYIVGHSMGGLISLLAVLSTKEPTLQFQGMVLMGPLIEIDPALASGFMKFLAMVASKVWPSFSLKGIDVKLVTSDKGWQERKTTDPLHYHGGAKALLGYVLIQAVDSLPAQFSKISLPLLILHGAEDKICSPGGSEALLEGVSSQDKTLEMIPGGLHNLYLEPEPLGAKLVATSLDWIVARI